MKKSQKKISRENQNVHFRFNNVFRKLCRLWDTWKAVTDLLSKYKWKVLPHAPYSPDMSPPDFDLFSKLKETMRGHRFSSLEEVSAAITRTIRGPSKSGTLNGIAYLPKRWDAVIEKQGDYIEGM
jgi:hypothetical protein